MPISFKYHGNYGHAYQGVFAQEDAQYSQYNRFRLRTYDKRIGRFLSPDPYNQYFSSYTGMGNNPVNLIDPSGGVTDGDISTINRFSFSEVNMWMYEALVIGVNWAERCIAVTNTLDFWSSAMEWIIYGNESSANGGSGGNSTSVSVSAGSPRSNWGSGSGGKYIPIGGVGELFMAGVNFETDPDEMITSYEGDPPRNVLDFTGDVIDGMTEDAANGGDMGYKISSTAGKYNNSTDWNYDVAKDNFPANSHKCNKFVYDVLVEAGADPGTPNGRLWKKYPPTASQWADPNYDIPGWKVVTNSRWGDVAAEAINYSDATGHVVIVRWHGYTIGTVHGTRIGITDWGYRPGQNVVFRRYVGPSY